MLFRSSRADLAGGATAPALSAVGAVALKISADVTAERPIGRASVARIHPHPTLVIPRAAAEQEHPGREEAGGPEGPAIYRVTFREHFANLRVPAQDSATRR